MKFSTNSILNMDDHELFLHCDTSVQRELGYFLREFNKREWSVRIAKKFANFDAYAEKGYEHQDRFGVGFVVNKTAVPYFHPNRSFHDEVIWLNNNLYYKKEVSFIDKVINSAIVKFYGPSRTLDIITGYANDLPYLKKTDYPYISFERLNQDEQYELDITSNIEMAYNKKQQIWGTTELRTSLQTAARNYARDKQKDITRKMYPSDMIHWIKYLSFEHEDEFGVNPGLAAFYKTKPTMQQSFEYLTRTRGIGNYYGYHFSSNLARMPGIGSAELIEREWSKEFALLNVQHGNLNENADYVVAGPGANATLKRLFPNMPINQQTTTRMILAIRDNQEEFFGIDTSESLQHLNEASELGRFTTFGIEISCCQFNVFTRLKDNVAMAINRAKAPISKEAVKETRGISGFFV